MTVWIYEISTGALWLYDKLVGRGYSGAPDSKNDPAKCAAHNHGPIPPGHYTIGEPRDSAAHGPFVLPLTPDPSNEMHGRSAFLIHGDSTAHPGAASEGCIIMPRVVREKVHASGVTALEVVA